ncbi:MAG: hypothetical protein IPO88_03595 [Nannocystis sp.]|uniref:ArnT family glycosyltransferase n=1 Tax=Nannocystis sp. TaxID=1962667 RepID=UPI0024244796|nr:hypothetical protein [Nannocystis sp.]MBK9752587.1 hypothetical protein [Nannocystis sp.]
MDAASGGSEGGSGSGWAGRLTRGPGLLVVLGVVLLVATRAWHPIAGLGNADIAGILYEADVICDGGVPYLDTIDMKSPGSWFVFAAIFAGLGRSIAAVQLAYTGWMLLAAPAIWLAARALYGRGLAAGAAVLLYLGAVGWFDLNYSAWMTTPYAWAFACLLLGLRGRWWWHLLGGLFAAVAVAIKTQAFVLAPCFALVWWWARRRGQPGATLSAWPLWAAGALLGLAPLLLWYQQQGGLGLVIAGLFPFESAGQYTAVVRHETWWGWRAWKIPLQLVAVFPLHAALSLAALLGAWRGRGEGGAGALPVLPQLVLLAMSVVGCGVGGLRFYVHYLPQYLPALALLAAHPRAWEYLRRAWAPGSWRARWLPAGLAALCGVVTLVLVVQIPLGMAARVDHRGNPRARAVGEYIAARTTANETVQVWGWAGWSVYFWAHRRAPSPVFKVLGQATEYNQNGLFTRSLSTDFRPGPAAEMMLAAFRAAPPAFFVRSASFFPGVKADPLEQWPEMREIVAEQYVLRKRFGKLRVYELRSRVPADELAALVKGAPAQAKVKARPRPKQRRR